MNWLKGLSFFVMIAIAIAASGKDEGLERMWSLFEEANSAYKNSAFDQAIDLYGQIIEQGYESEKVYFNLANCYYKKNSLTYALLYYERAFRLDPEDEDILHNLNIARNQMADKVEPLPSFFLSDYWDGFSMMQSPDQWSVWFLVWLALACALFTLFIAARKRNIKQLGFSLSILFLLSAALCIAAATHADNMLSKPEAIVFASTLNVKSEPGLNATDQFVIHEGLKVEVVQEEGEWVRIRLEDGNSGWVRNQSIERI